MIRIDSRQMVIVGLCASIVAAMCTVAVAEPQAMSVVASTEPQPAEQPRIVTMTFRPQAAAQPALRYTLLPDLLDQTPGNALPLYFLAIDLMENQEGAKMDAFGNSLIESLKKPLAELASSDEIRSLLERHHEVLAQVTLAARRETCVWDLPVREQGIHMPLPSLTRFRTLARLVALQARLQIAEGRNADACRTVQTGLAMARHMGQGPTLISALVAVAMAELTLDRVAELIQNTDAPNLYWALTDLPQSFIDARTPMQFEKSILYLTFPQLRNLADAALTPEQAQALSDEIVRILDSRETGWNARLAAAAVAIKVYPIAKQHLVSLGYTPERMEAMPVQQTILLYWLDQYTRSRDEMFKWFSVPYWQAAEGLRAAEAKLAENPDRLLNPCIALLPSLRKAHLRTTMPDRSIAALRCIEAVRLHAAAHDGRPPTQLDDITLVPIPIDPITGAPFRYEVNGNQILLEGPAPVDGSPKDGLRYEMTLTQ